ncbi:hypothetical protein [Paenibacillus graminis]
MEDEKLVEVGYQDIVL